MQQKNLEWKKISSKAASEWEIESLNKIFIIICAAETKNLADIFITLINT